MPSGKRTGPRIPNRPAPRGARLRSATDTSATASSPQTKGRSTEGYEKVGVLPKELRPSEPVNWEQVKLVGKIIAGVISAIAVVAGGIITVAYLTGYKLSEFALLQTDVKDVKQKTDKLADETREHSLRLNTVEKGVSTLQSDIKDLQQKGKPPGTR